MTPGIMVVVAAVVDTWAGLWPCVVSTATVVAPIGVVAVKGSSSSLGVLWMVALPSSSSGNKGKKYLLGILASGLS